MVLLLESMELERLVKNTENIGKLRRLAANKSWILGSVGVDEELVEQWSTKYQTTLLVMQPHITSIPDFQNHFLGEIEASFVCQISAFIII